MHRAFFAVPNPPGIGRCGAGVCGFAAASVVGTMNATVGGQTLLPNTTLFSGDSLQVKDGVAVVALGNASRMVFGRDTVALFLRDSDEVTTRPSRVSQRVSRKTRIMKLTRSAKRRR